MVAVVVVVAAMAVTAAAILIVAAGIGVVIIMTRLSIRIGPVARRNWRFLLRDHQVAVVVVVVIA